MPGLYSWQKLHKGNVCTVIAILDAIGGAVNLLSDLLKCGAIEQFAAENAAVERMKTMLIDEFSQFRPR